MQYEYVYGLHTVEALLKFKANMIQKLLFQMDRHDIRFQELMKLAVQHNIFFERVDKKMLDNLVGQETLHQGVLAQCRINENLDESVLYTLLDNATHPLLFLILDQIQDPHNLGACFRSADAFGVDAVIAPKHRAASITPVVRKVASGATITVPFIQVTNLARTLQRLKDENVWIVGLDASASSQISQLDLTGHIGIVMGNEGEGMRKLTKENCDFLAKIPMQGTVSSLNVSIATAISLYEVYRQRNM